MNRSTSFPTLLTLDTCVLMHSFTRHVFLHLYKKEICEIAWSHEIGKEWLRNAPRIWKVETTLVENEWITMQTACPRANMGDIPEANEIFKKTDKKDRHVALCALLAQRRFHKDNSVLLTWNTKDFHKKELREHGILLQTPDHYLSELWTNMAEKMAIILKSERLHYIEQGLPEHPMVELLKRDKLFRLANLYTTTLSAS